jgi:hypothetical protein
MMMRGKRLHRKEPL